MKEMWYFKGSTRSREDSAGSDGTFSGTRDYHSRRMITGERANRICLEEDVLTPMPTLYSPFPKANPPLKQSNLRPFGPENKYAPNDPGLSFVEVVPERPLKLKRIVFLVVKDAMVRAALPDKRTEAIVARDALAQHIGVGQHVIGRCSLLEQGEDAALLRH